MTWIVRSWDKLPGFPQRRAPVSKSYDTHAAALAAAVNHCRVFHITSVTGDDFTVGDDASLAVDLERARSLRELAEIWGVPTHAARRRLTSHIAKAAVDSLENRFFARYRVHREEWRSASLPSIRSALDELDEFSRSYALRCGGAVPSETFRRLTGWTES